MAKQNNTKVVTGLVRLSYANVWEPKSINGGDPKFSCSIIIPKTDVETVNAINAAIDCAIKEGVGKFGGKIPPKGALKLPLRDGDTERDDDAYAGCYFVNANSNERPGVVDRRRVPITDPLEVYSGCYVRASITFYPFNTNGNKGIGVGLNNIQKLKDDDRLGAARASAESDFGGDDFEDDEDF